MLSHLKKIYRIKIVIRTRQHFRTQGQKKNGRLRVVWLLIRLFFKDFKRATYAKGNNLVTGKGLYDKPLLVSYPRCATNWTRYIIESISGKPTPGNTRVHSGDDFIIDRAHHGAPVIDRYSKAILILRDYRECLLRHSTELWLEYKDVERFLEEPLFRHPPKWYIENIKGFDAFEGEKLLVYYEDLLTEPEQQIRRITDFLEFEQTDVDAFLADLKNKQQESVQSYSSGSHISVTQGKPDKFKHHADAHLSMKQKADFDRYYEERFPDLFDKYLSRYRIK